MGKLDTGLSAVRTVLTLRLAPVLLLVFVVVWPIAGFPWWPIALVLVLGVLLRGLGFGYLIAGKRGPVLLVSLLVATTLLAWSPWAVVTALGAALAIAGAFRLPRWKLLVVGMVLFLGAGSGWVAETVITAKTKADSYEQTSYFNWAQLLPRSPRGVLGGVMESVADGDVSAACTLFTDLAKVQLAAAFKVTDCPAAVTAWHAQITRHDSYGLSNRLKGDTSTTSPDHETGTVTGCDLSWIDPINGTELPAGPVSPGRMQVRRVLGQGYEITDYRPC